MTTHTPPIEEYPDLAAMRARYDQAAARPTAQAVDGLAPEAVSADSRSRVTTPDRFEPDRPRSGSNTQQPGTSHVLPL